MTYADYRQGNGRFGAAAPGARPEPPPVPLMQAPGPGTPPDGGVPGSRRRITRPRLLWAGIAVAVAAAGYAAGYFTAPSPQATRFLLVTSVPLPAGARLASADLTTVQVTARDAAPPGALSSAAAPSVIGQVSATALPRGTFLSQSLLADKGAVPGPAQALVGLALKPGQVPDGSLADGQQVRVVALPENVVRYGAHAGVDGQHHRLGRAGRRLLRRHRSYGGDPGENRRAAGAVRRAARSRAGRCGVREQLVSPARERVTVVSPFGQQDIDVPVDVPVAAFLPDLLAMAGLSSAHPDPAGDGWQVTDATGTLITRDDTLAAHGISTGGAIQLRRIQPRAPGRPSTAASRPQPSDPAPPPRFRRRARLRRWPRRCPRTAARRCSAPRPCCPAPSAWRAGSAARCGRSSAAPRA